MRSARNREQGLGIRARCGSWLWLPNLIGLAALLGLIGQDAGKAFLAWIFVVKVQ